MSPLLTRGRSARKLVRRLRLASRLPSLGLQCARAPLRRPKRPLQLAPVGGLLCKLLLLLSHLSHRSFRDAARLVHRGSLSSHALRRARRLRRRLRRRRARRRNALRSELLRLRQTRLRLLARLALRRRLRLRLPHRCLRRPRRRRRLRRRLRRLACPRLRRRLCRPCGGGRRLKFRHHPLQLLSRPGRLGDRTPRLHRRRVSCLAPLALLR